METTFQYLRQFGPLLAERILETYPPFRARKTLSRHLSRLFCARLCRHRPSPSPEPQNICAGQRPHASWLSAARARPLALGTIHVLVQGHPSTTLVMCPSHITHKWAREVL